MDKIWLDIVKFLVKRKNENEKKMPENQILSFR